MTHGWFRTGILILAATALGACVAHKGNASNPTSVEPNSNTSLAARDGVFIHITHSGETDPHRVLMGLRMAELMVGDRDVLVYFDIKGVEIPLKNADDTQMSPFPSSKAQLATLIGKGAKVYVCPGCMEAAGKTAADLMPGIEMADKEAFFRFTRGRILTLDY